MESEKSVEDSGFAGEEEEEEMGGPPFFLGDDEQDYEEQEELEMPELKFPEAETEDAEDGLAETETLSRSRSEELDWDWNWDLEDDAKDQEEMKGDEKNVPPDEEAPSEKPAEAAEPPKESELTSKVPSSAVYFKKNPVDDSTLHSKVPSQALYFHPSSSARVSVIRSRTGKMDSLPSAYSSVLSVRTLSKDRICDPHNPCCLKPDPEIFFHQSLLRSQARKHCVPKNPLHFEYSIMHRVKMRGLLRMAV